MKMMFHIKYIDKKEVNDNDNDNEMTIKIIYLT